MMPGPPPVMIAKPARASRRAVATATPYIGSLRGVRAEPKIVTAGPTSASASKPATNSPWMRRTRHGSVWVKSAARCGCGFWAGLTRSCSSSVGRPLRAARFSDGFGCSGDSSSSN